MIKQSISIVSLIVFPFCAAFGQSIDRSSATFEVASVKRARAGDSRGSTFQFMPGGGLQVTNGTLKGIIETAYDVRDFQISGGPGWLNSEAWDISARSSPSGDNGMNETRRRLQALLAQRFRLKVHREMRELPVYALTIARGGARLSEGDASKTSEGPRTGIRKECGQMKATLASMANLTVYLARQLDRPVLDRTDLSGRYNFELDWIPDAGPCPSPAAGDAASIFTALEEQLGLKLESTKDPVETIVVDYAEKADAN